MSVAHHANYLAWFEVGRTEWCRANGFAYRDLEVQEGILLMVAEARCRYKAPAHYDDVLSIRTQVNSFKKRIIAFGYEIVNAATRELVATGETIHAVTDRKGRVRSLPDKYAAFFRSNEL
jgi:acyl-CoA thioester hydrolase